MLLLGTKVLDAAICSENPYRSGFARRREEERRDLVAEIGKKEEVQAE
jgi:hypothetical protein